MKVYLAYTWEYMEEMHLAGVYSSESVAVYHAKEQTRLLDRKTADTLHIGDYFYPAH